MPITWNIAVAMDPDRPGAPVTFKNSPCVALNPPAVCRGKAILNGFSFFYTPGDFYPVYTLDFTGADGVLTSANYAGGRSLSSTILVLDHGTLTFTGSMPVQEPAVLLFTGIGLVGGYARLRRRACSPGVAHIAA
jgi:hypothetical protein